MSERFNFVRDHQNKDGRFSLYECLNCEVQFWNPFKGPGKEWYEKEYDYKARNILISKAYRTCHKKFLKMFENIPLGTRILDIGCGVGEFLAELQNKGGDVWGVDFNGNLTGIAKNKFGLKNIYTMDFNEFFNKKDLPQFDIVTFFGVLEHIDNPLELIQKIKKILKPNGIIASSAPCKENLVTGMNNKDLPPDHLTQWNQKSLAILFQKIGFDIFCLEYLGQFQSFKSVIIEKSRFRLGLVDKTAQKRPNVILLKIVRLLGDIKDYIIGGIPAGFLCLISWLMGRKGAAMFVILKQYEK